MRGQAHVIAQAADRMPCARRRRLIRIQFEFTYAEPIGVAGAPGIDQSKVQEHAPAQADALEVECSDQVVEQAAHHPPHALTHTQLIRIGGHAVQARHHDQASQSGVCLGRRGSGCLMFLG